MVEFNDTEIKDFNDVPDHVLHEINALTTDIMLLLLIDSKGEEERARRANIAFGAMQQAVGLVISQFFEKKAVSRVTAMFCANLMYNAELWSQMPTGED